MPAYLSWLENPVHTRSVIGSNPIAGTIVIPENIAFSGVCFSIAARRPPFFWRSPCFLFAHRRDGLSAMRRSRCLSGARLFHAVAAKDLDVNAPAA